jgi:hypothetical protein
MRATSKSCKSDLEIDCCFSDCAVPALFGTIAALAAMLDFLFKAVVSTARDAHNAHRERTVLVCPRCRTEYAKGARCCVRCGAASDAAITLGELHKRDEKERAATNRLLSLKHRYDVLVRESYCHHCDSIRNSGIKFCPDCTQPCETPPPREVVFKQLHGEYPDLVATLEDLRRVACTHIPIARRTGYAMFDAVRSLFR